MKVKIFVDAVELQPGFYSFAEPRTAFVAGKLNEQLVAELAQECGIPLKRVFQSSCDAHGAYTIGLRYKPVAIVVPQGHPKFNAEFILGKKMTK